MSIPLDRLYNYIEDTARDIRGGRVLIYRFSPNGSKKIEDLTMFGDFSNLTGVDKLLIPYMYCHDQEPLNYNLYKDYKQPHSINVQLDNLIKKYQIDLPTYYFPMVYHNIYDHALLLHSEKRSFNISQYQADNFIPVYYWSHAIIALDWFRFAQHLPAKKTSTDNPQIQFLVYNRAWSGTREYRLKFADLIVQSNLVDNCRMSFNPVEPELNVHYTQHNYENPSWKPLAQLENFFPLSTAPSYYSADFDMHDYSKTDIEVVLETLFDDSRLHLTEKSLRPFACGQPFILGATYGSLDYLRSYGFKTFDHIWEEKYDLIKDPHERLEEIVNLMKRIASWDPVTREYKMIQARAVAEYNKKHFFSKEFINHLIDEFYNNLQSGLKQLENENTSQIWFARRKKLFCHDEIRDFLMHPSNNHYAPQNQRESIMKVVSTARKYYQRSLNRR